MVCIDWYLPGYKAGGPIRSCANLVGFLCKDYNFKIVTTNVDYNDTEPYKTVKANEWLLLEPNVQAYYFSKDKLTTTNVRALLKKTDYDILYVNGIFSFYFTILPLFFSNKVKIVAVRGMLAQSALKIKKVKKIGFIYLAKLLGVFKDVVFHATSKEEVVDTRNFFSNPIKYAPNLPRFNTDSSTIPNTIKEQGKLRIINVARVSPEKNLLFALSILREIKGEVVFHIYGPINDNAYWQRCQSEIDRMPANVKVEKFDAVESSQIHSLVAKYDLFFMPTLGENFGHVILESLTAGVPVLVSDKTPWNNLSDYNCGWHYSLNSPNDFISKIESLVSLNSTEYNMFRENATKFISLNSNTEQSVLLYRQMFDC